jgi:5-methylcytosine-specific restriction endonuclease McrA
VQHETHFDQNVVTAVHRRQSGVCAHCGTSVSWDHDRPHAVFPFNPTSSNFTVNAWLKEPENCVILCYGCHTWVYIEPDGVGDWSGPGDFPFSHGMRDSGAHKEWVIRLMGRTGA